MLNIFSIPRTLLRSEQSSFRHPAPLPRFRQHLQTSSLLARCGRGQEKRWGPGFTFVLLEARGDLPRMFALPAGYGDMAIGATAAFLAWQVATPRHRNLFLLSQALGILDLVIAVTLGTTARLIDPHGVSMIAMTMLPLNLVPTFLVPLFTILYVICIAQAKRWNSGSQVDLVTNPAHLTV